MPRLVKIRSKTKALGILHQPFVDARLSLNLAICIQGVNRLTAMSPTAERLFEAVPR